MRPLRIPLFCLLMTHALAFAQGLPARSSGQVLYLPVYSHIWHGDPARAGAPMRTLMSVLVSVRNTSASRPIRLISAVYYDTDGKKLKEYVSSPRTIGPMGTFELFVPRSDDTGGSGANFVISWQADRVVNAPVVEALHVNLPAGRSIAFTTSARQIDPD